MGQLDRAFPADGWAAAGPRLCSPLAGLAGDLTPNRSQQGTEQRGRATDRAQRGQGTVPPAHGASGARSTSAGPGQRAVGLMPGAFPPAGKSMVSEQTDKV